MFFERLEKACFDKKISVSRLLRELGFSTSSVTYWRKGSMPKIDKLVKLSEYLDVPISYLIEGETQAFAYSSNDTEKLSATGRTGEINNNLYSSKSSITDRELGRLEGRIEELEKKNTEYKEIIENRDNQLRNVVDKMARHVEKMSNHLNSTHSAPPK